MRWLKFKQITGHFTDAGEKRKRVFRYFYRVKDVK